MIDAQEQERPLAAFVTNSGHGLAKMRAMFKAGMATMSRESDVRGRMFKVASRLLKETLEGRVPWTPTDKEQEFLYSGTKSSVVISHHEDRDGDDVYTMSLLDTRGTVVEQLRSDYVPSQGAFQPTMEPAAWNDTLEQLHDAARREALNIDALLDGVLEDLEKGPPPPKPPSKKVAPEWNDDPWAETLKPTRPTFDENPPF